MDQLLIFGAKYLFLLSILITLIYFLSGSKKKKKEMIIFFLISLPLIYLAAILLRHFFYNPRPFVVGNFSPLIPHAPDNGFPSDHALLTSALASVIMYFNKKIGLLLWIIAILVSLSRVYVGLHHLADVFASIIISLIITAIIYLILKRRNFSFSYE